jgi:hypothetical protein
LREGINRDLFAKQMVIGTFAPVLGDAIKGSMILEEAMGREAPWYMDGDPVDESGDPATGWIRQDGDDWVWRSVSKVLTMLIVFVGFPRSRKPRQRRPRRLVWAGRRGVVGLSQKLFFALDLAVVPKCVLIVPCS